MKYFLKNAVLINRLPEIIPAVEAVAYSPAVPATEFFYEIQKIFEVVAQPRKYIFEATVFIGIEGTPAKEFIQDKNFYFTVTGEKTLTEIETQLLIEAQNYINNNYPNTP